MEREVRGRLEAVSEPGWSDVIVIEPEVEAWVWSDSPHVDACLGWHGRQPSLRHWLMHEGLMEPGGIKPRDPKEAFRRAVEETRTVPSSALFGKLARTVSVERCTDDAFNRFRQRLCSWFPP